MSNPRNYHKKLTHHLWNTKSLFKWSVHQTSSRRTLLIKLCSIIHHSQRKSVTYLASHRLESSLPNLEVKIPKLRIMLSNFWLSHVHPKKTSLLISKSQHQHYHQWRILFLRESTIQYVRSPITISRPLRSTTR